MPEIEKAADAENQRADKVHEQILHRVVEANVQIPVKAKVDSIDGYSF